MRLIGTILAIESQSTIEHAIRQIRLRGRWERCDNPGKPTLADMRAMGAGIESKGLDLKIYMLARWVR